MTPPLIGSATDLAYYWQVPRHTSRRCHCQATRYSPSFSTLTAAPQPPSLSRLLVFFVAFHLSQNVGRWHGSVTTPSDILQRLHQVNHRLFSPSFCQSPGISWLSLPRPVAFYLSRLCHRRVTRYSLSFPKALACPLWLLSDPPPPSLMPPVVGSATDLAYYWQDPCPSLPTSSDFAHPACALLSGQAEFHVTRVCKHIKPMAIKDGKVLWRT